MKYSAFNVIIYPQNMNPTLGLSVEIRQEKKRDPKSKVNGFIIPQFMMPFINLETEPCSELCFQEISRG